MTTQHFDLIIIGAGLSGIGSACRIAQEYPDKSLAIIERREKMGGTWDLFRYPGIRSDSDMASFGYNFKPWHSDKVLAKGGDIRDYVAETAREFNLQDKVHFGLHITSADWSSEDQRWTVTATHEKSGEPRQFTCSFMLNCAGYYNFDQGYRPTFKGEENFRGDIVHPQFWPESLDYSGKKVVVIGSGATAITVVPAMAEKAASVTMLQRSPSYIMAMPDTDKISMALNKVLPKDLVFRMARKRNILFQRGLYLACERWPNAMRKVMLGHMRRRVGPDVDMRHFTPKYNPWEQRLCAAPDGDFFTSLRSGKAGIVTDHIDHFTENGIVLKSGQTLDADLVVTATGLDVQLMGGLQLLLDGTAVDMPSKMTYKGIMLQDVPNYGWIFGYTNAPWTLKCDIGGQYICRLFDEMGKRGAAVVRPVDTTGNETGVGMLDEFAPGYIVRAKDRMPRQGRSGPWKVTMHYGKDKKMLVEDPVADGQLQFEKPVAANSGNIRTLKATA
ncbi:flavin-containing monooxygenase [Marinobacter mobilis]|uniref:Predicted flavoprotein CzcO associated with the cation diffusion facilitator CzcD n=1 Tax=Marinobacter mobilis TaxID=488533 RepID=A0A1H2XUN7_9GAMM|nr:NAD(P)/FAD-dependent oxidoreductase [Marinobacter mobilis]SDW96029.1 Predicted flavoprotein CzcO associated with the cation diffusion facilitator CzcD [Marinobacter mobilis]